MRLDDPEVVRAEYASEVGLESRASIYRGLAGPDAREVAFEAIAEAAPANILEVGCGPGELAARLRAQVTANLVAVDISPRMVELARARGVEAVVGDVCALPFESQSFDCAVANWMLYHASDIEAALAELARVLRAGGRLVATTNSTRHLEELWALVGQETADEPCHFSAEDGAQLLRRHFARVSRRDVVGRISFDADGARRYIGSSVVRKHLADRVPELPEPLVATRRCTVFVAETAS